MKLERPVPHKGALGTWPIDAAVLQSVQSQLRTAAVREADPAALPPPHAPGPLKRKRAESVPKSGPSGGGSGGGSGSGSGGGGGGGSASAVAAGSGASAPTLPSATQKPPALPLPPPPPPAPEAFTQLVSKVGKLVSGVGEAQIAETLRACEYNLARAVSVLKDGVRSAPLSRQSGRHASTR